MSAVLAMRKEEGSGSVEFGTPARVEWHLENWRRWMRSGQEVDGMPGRSSGCSDGGTSRGFDEMVECEDRRCAKIVDVILDNLPPHQRIAVYIERRIMMRVTRFEQANYDANLKAAKGVIGRELSRRGVW